MDGILPILMVIISVLSAISKMQKKKEAERKKAAVPAVPVEEMKTPESRPIYKAAPAFPPAPVFQAPQMGTEGEDLCHEYMLPDEDETGKDALAQENTGDNERTQELVRGVILSEILARPRGMGRRRA